MKGDRFWRTYLPDTCPAKVRILSYNCTVLILGKAMGQKRKKKTWDRRAQVWQVVQDLVAIRNKGRELCYCLGKKGWGQPVGEFPVQLLGKFVTCLELRIHVAPLSQMEPAWLEWLLGPDSVTYYRSCYAVLGGATALGISVQSRRNYSSFSLLRNLPMSQLSDLLGSKGRRDVEPSYLAALCQVLSGSVPPENAVHFGMGDKLWL